MRGLHQEERKDLEGKDDHYHQQGDLNQQHKELREDLRHDQFWDIDPGNPRPVDEPLLSLNYKGQRSEADGDPKRHTTQSQVIKESVNK